jgi:phosphoglycolate phosphatase
MRPVLGFGVPMGIEPLRLLWFVAKSTAIPQFEAYLFDIDGTLLDSAPDICGTIQEVVLREGVPEPSFPYLRSFVGLHLRDCFLDILPGCSEEKLAGLIQDYRATYKARGHKDTRIYPGVAEGLARLGGKKSTATTKGSPMAASILEQFELHGHFDHVQGTDGFPYKPAPDVILTALRALGAEPSACLMVGDAVADILAARAAGVKVCAVRYGYGDPAKLAALEPDYWVSDLRELAVG